MKFSEVQPQSLKEVPIGCSVRVLTNNYSDHKYEIGEIYEVVKYYKNDNKHTHFQIRNPDTDDIGDWIHYKEVVVLQKKLRGILGKKSTPFDLKYMDKVILPGGHKKAILETLAQEQAENKEKLFVTWGFDEWFEKGKGIVFMFWGVPGTGKTLCAESMAKYLKVDHIVMTTADIQSSVPGEAERNIQKFFNQAKSNKALIIIDECDSLLYDRNSVGAIMSAEINCLLTEIEKFDGVCVMTTNRNQKLDPALERRIALKLEFPKPNKISRIKIWTTLIPEKCPLHKDVKVAKLAEHDLCGGHIKNAIFSAARKAIHDGEEKVRMKHLVMGIRREVDAREAFTEGRGNEIYLEGHSPVEVTKVASSRRLTKVKVGRSA